MKDVAKFIPGIGWMFYFMEYPIVKRSWDKDKPRLAAACRNLADYPINMLVSEWVNEWMNKWMSHERVGEWVSKLAASALV